MEKKKRKKIVKVHLKCVSKQNRIQFDSDRNQASQVAHQVNAYLQFLWYEVTRSISTPSWMLYQPVTELTPQHYIWQ